MFRYATHNINMVHIKDLDPCRHKDKLPRFGGVWRPWRYLAISRTLYIHPTFLRDSLPGARTVWRRFISISMFQGIHHPCPRWSLVLVWSIGRMTVDVIAGVCVC